MAVDRTRYRQLDFLPSDPTQNISTQILQSRELDWLQRMDEGVSVLDDETAVSGALQTIYRQGAMLNITVSVSGLSLTLAPTNPSLPMYIFVKDQWEIFPSNNDDCTDSINGTTVGNVVMTLTSSQTVIYLNWELKVRTGGLSGDDPLLTDAITNEPTANAGELILHLNVIDTSGTPRTTNQLATNISPIELLIFTNSGTTLTFVPTDNVQNQALATETISGLVKLAAPGGGVAASVNDPRFETGPSGSSVYDSIVRTPEPFGGLNSNGTEVYKLPTDGGSDIGGISAAKIVLIATTQLLEDGWNALLASVSNLWDSFDSHYTAVLGLSNTHPVPTAAQIGAAPISHVGQVLGLVTSHPPVVVTQSGGFQVDQTILGAANDPGFSIYTKLANTVSLNHDGDIWSILSNAYVASPGGSGITVTGPLGHISTIAGVLSQHVNQVSHCNPHGLTAADLGALTGAAILANFSQVGYVQIPTSVGTLIVQWGAQASPHNGLFIPYALTFPNAVFFVIPQGVGGSVNIASVAKNGFTINASATEAYWIAMGY